jgi:hypothetical protein
MSKENLIEKINSWTLESAQNALKYMPFDSFRSHFIDIFKYADGGVYVYHSYIAKFFTDTGTIETALAQVPQYQDIYNPIVPRTIDNDFTLLNQLYTRAQSSDNVRLALVNEISLVDGYEYRSYTAPDNQLGVPLLVEELSAGNLLTDDYIKAYIDDIAWFLQQINSINPSDKFPDTITLDNRLKNDFGYYYYDIGGFANTYHVFYNNQISYLRTKILGNLSGSQLLNVHVNNPQEIIEYAEGLWTL